MKALISEKKTEKQSCRRKKLDQGSICRMRTRGPEFIRTGYHPPGSFVPLLTKIVQPAQRGQLLGQLHRHYGNRYVQRVISAYRMQNGADQEDRVASEILAKKGSGRPLEPELRRFFEPRFGYSFSGVRIHTDAFAAGAARDLGAEAFTIGQDVFFGAGRYQPLSANGKRLIAHELAHVVQQAPLISKKIQFWSYGTGSVPGDPDFIPVPADHRARARSAMDIITGVAGNRRCSNYFRRNCPSGETAQQVLNRVRLWEYRTRGVLGVTNALGGSEIAYDPDVYRIGRWFIASTLLHEMMHACGQHDERTCEMAPDECYVFTPYVIRSITPSSGRVGDIISIEGAFSVGPNQGPLDRIEFNGIDAGRALSWVYSHAGTVIRVRVPAGLTPGTVNVVVINNTIPSNPRPFTVRL